MGTGKVGKGDSLPVGHWASHRVGHPSKGLEKGRTSVHRPPVKHPQHPVNQAWQCSLCLSRGETETAESL